MNSRVIIRFCTRVDHLDIKIFLHFILKTKLLTQWTHRNNYIMTGSSYLYVSWKRFLFLSLKEEDHDTMKKTISFSWNRFLTMQKAKMILYKIKLISEKLQDNAKVLRPMFRYDKKTLVIYVLSRIFCLNNKNCDSLIIISYEIHNFDVSDETLIFDSISKKLTSYWSLFS